MRECPGWVREILNEAMDDLVKNFTSMVKDEHRRVIRNRLVTMFVPYTSEGCFEVKVQDNDGYVWVRKVRVRDVVLSGGRSARHVSSEERS